MELLFVRHGQPEWERDGLSVDDPRLTDTGARQAEHLAAALGDEPVDHLFVSPLRRARETAAPLADALGAEPEVLGWLPEIAAPRWEGTPVEVVQRVFAESRDRPLEEQWDGLPDGESFRDFHRRVTDGLDGLLDRLGAHRLNGFPPLWSLDDPGPRVVVVAHAGTNAVCLGHLLGIEAVPWEWERFVSFHASVSVVRPMPISRAHSFSLYRFSDTGHLPAELQTR